MTARVRPNRECRKAGWGQRSVLDHTDDDRGEREQPYSHENDLLDTHPPSFTLAYRSGPLRGHLPPTGRG
jgi:hypothetical protein